MDNKTFETKLQNLETYVEDKEFTEEEKIYTFIIAKLILGLKQENPDEISDLINKIMYKN